MFSEVKLGSEPENYAFMYLVSFSNYGNIKKIIADVSYYKDEYYNKNFYNMFNNLINYYLSNGIFNEILFLNFI